MDIWKRFKITFIKKSISTLRLLYFSNFYSFYKDYSIDYFIFLEKKLI